MVRPNVELVLNIYQAIKEKDTKTIAALSAPNIQVYQSDELPWGGQYAGIGQAMQFFGKVTSHLDSHVIVDKVLDAGDYVAVTGRTAGLVKTNGKAFDVALVHLWRVEQGQVSSLSVFVDNVSILPALSLSD